MHEMAYHAGGTMTEGRSRISGARRKETPFQVDMKCRECKGHHQVSGTVELELQPILFGGGGGSVNTHEKAWSGPVNCPVTQKMFEATLMLPIPENETLGRVVITDVTHLDESPPMAADSSKSGAETAAQPARDWIDEELAEWRKTSVSTARTYATTMLTTASGAVAVYFAVLKYLGFEQHGHGPWAWVAGVPPVFFLVSAGCFAFALRPSLSYVERSEYVDFRAKRIGQMHTRSSWAGALYGIGLLLAVSVFLWLM